MTPAERKAAFDVNVVVTDLDLTSGGLPRGPAADGAALRPFVIFEETGCVVGQAVGHETRSRRSLSALRAVGRAVGAGRAR
jgi:hypothetical protein